MSRTLQVIEPIDPRPLNAVEVERHGAPEAAVRRWARQERAAGRAPRRRADYSHVVDAAIEAPTVREAIESRREAALLALAVLDQAGYRELVTDQVADVLGVPRLVQR